MIVSIEKLTKFIAEHDLVLQITTTIDINGSYTEAKILDFCFSSGVEVLGEGNDENEALNNLVKHLETVSVIKRVINYDSFN